MSIIQINEQKVDINKGATYVIYCSIVPQYPINNKLNFSVANENIAKIISQTENSITVQGLGQGTTTINVSCDEDPTVTNIITCNITDPYYTQIFEKKNFSKIYVQNNNLKLFKGDIKEVKYKFYPCFLVDSSIKIVSSDESIVKVTNNIGVALTLEAVGVGNATITLTSVEDPSFFTTISVGVLNNIESPTIYEKKNLGKKVTIILDKSPNSNVITLVNFGWDAKNEIDLSVSSSKFEFEVPSYDTDYYIKIAYQKGDVISQWLTENIKVSEKTQEEIENELKEKIQREGINLKVTSTPINDTKYNVFLTGENVDTVEYQLSFESYDNVHTLSYDKSKLQNVLKIESPDDYSKYSIKVRGLNAKGKVTPWIEEDFTIYNTGGVNPSSMDYNFDSAFFTVFEEEGMTPVLYDSVCGSATGTASMGQVFTSDTSNDDDVWIPCNANVPIHMVAAENISEGRYYDWGTITDASGGTHYVEVGNGFFINVYNLKSLCYENCLGRDLGGFILYGSYGTATMKKFDLIKRDNFAVACVAIEGELWPVAGFKLLKDTKIYDINGNELLILKQGNWIWMCSQSANIDDENYITGGEKMSGDIQKMAIHSYSTDTTFSEIIKNWAKDSNGNKNGIYFMDTYFDLGMQLYAIDTQRLSDRKTTIQSDIVNGYFDFDNYGTPALLWSGSKYAIRSSIDNSDEVGTNNVLGHMHQGYLLTTSTGEDISSAYVGNACAWNTINRNSLKNIAMGNLINTYSDRHKVEEFFFAKGFFDTGSITEGYFIGKKYISLCTPEWRHSQNCQHVGFKGNGQEYVLSEKQEEILSTVSKSKKDNPMMEKENLQGYSNSILSSFFPYIQYIFKRIRKKCVDETGEALDLLQVFCKAYKSNFAIYNDPINGVEINEKKSYKPLYGVKVLKNNTKLYVQKSITSKELDLALNSNDKTVLLNEGDWVWFSEDYPPKISYANENCISIVAYSLGTDINGDPEGQIQMASCYVDAGLSNVSKKIDTSLDEIKRYLHIDNLDNKGENDISFPYSALNYNIATMANPDGNEPHLLFEDEEYGKILKNTLCYNITPNDIHVVMEDGTSDVIKTGRLFTFIGEYSSANIKFSRVYYYSDIAKAYKYASIETPSASLFNLYILNTATRTFTVDNKEFGILQLPTVTKIFTRYGEQYVTTEVREGVLDAVLFNNTIEYNKKSEKFDIMNLPKYIANKGLLKVDDSTGLNEINEPLMQNVNPNWLSIEYYLYNGYERILVKQRLKGYVKLDFSADYSRLIR